MSNQWGRVGYQLKDRRVIIRGEVTKNNQLWEYLPSINAWLFSSYHLSDIYIKKMVDKLNKIKPEFIHVYPSSMWIFVNLMIENNLKLNFTPQAILCGSEKLYDHQRKLFTGVFGCRTYSWLGLTEQTILAGECEYSSDLHIFPQHSYIELIDDNGKLISEPGKTGHIVGTTLHRYTFPLLRYVSGDMAKYAAGTCKCRRNYSRLSQVEGRAQYAIVSRDGRIIPLVALNHLLAYNKIIKMQIFQCKPGEVEVRIIRKSSFTEEDAEFFKNKLIDATDHSVSFKITYHDNLERTPGGKDRFLIQHLPLNLYTFDKTS
jgi:phenylacetate-CoA ligase